MLVSFYPLLFGLFIHTNVSLNHFTASHTLIGADKFGQSTNQLSVPEYYVLVFGNEAHGLSDDSHDILNELVKINKQGFGDSLNVAVAGSILMHHFANKKD